MEKVLKKFNFAIDGNISLNKKESINVFLSVVSFFLGRVFIFDSINPIAISFLSLYLFRNFRFGLISFSMALGIITVFSGIYLFKYLVCIFILSFANLLINKKSTVLFQGFIGFISICLSGIIIGSIDNFNFFYMLLSFVEGILTFSLVFILKSGINILEGNVKRRMLSGEEVISLSIILGSLIAGASGIYFLDIPLNDFFSSLVILFISYKGGVTLGALSGIFLGIMLLLTGYKDNTIITVLSISGICGGIFSNKNKILSVFTFSLGRILITYYMNYGTVDNVLYFSIAAADLVFLFINEKIYFNFIGFVNSYNETEDDYIKRIRYITTSKLRNFSKAFNKLSVTFNGISDKKTSFNQNDVSKIIDEISSKVCNCCSLYNNCWKEDFFNTYQSVFIMLSNLEKKGDIYVTDINPEFLNTCINLTDFVEITKRVFEIQRNNLIWQNKIIESRELVAEQLMGVSELINNLSEELDFEMTFKEDLEQKLLTEFSLKKISALSVIILENKNKKLEIYIKLSTCIKEKDCVKTILPIINHVVGKKMRKENVDCGSCKLKFVEEEKFKISSAVAKAVKDNSESSGDSYSFLELDSGEILLALSDGMGSGFAAKMESSATIDLLEEFIETGFKKELAIKMINSILVLKSSSDSFSTLDICTINAYTGNAEFAKIGASSTFLLRDKKVELIKSSNLPMGILNSVDIEITSKKLHDDDIIVLATDGVLELENTKDKEKWIIDYLTSTETLNPEDIARELLELAKRKSKNEIKDDMTIFVVRVWEKI